MTWLNWNATTTAAKIGKYEARAVAEPSGTWTWEVRRIGNQIASGEAPTQNDAEMMAQRCVADWVEHDQAKLDTPTPREDPPPATTADEPVAVAVDEVVF